MNKVLIHSRASRLFHWSLALSIMVALPAGFYYHYPLDLGPHYGTGLNGFIKQIASFASMAVFSAWVYYIAITGDYRNHLFSFSELKHFLPLFKYYLFVEKKLPPHPKYNIGQRFFHVAWFLGFLIQSGTGLLLLFPDWTNLVVPLTHQQLRYYHFMVALFFAGSIFLHIYLALTEDPARLQSMFTGWIKRSGPQKPSRN